MAQPNKSPPDSFNMKSLKGSVPREEEDSDGRSADGVPVRAVGGAGPGDDDGEQLEAEPSKQKKEKKSKKKKKKTKKNKRSREEEPASDPDEPKEPAPKISTRKEAAQFAKSKMSKAKDVANATLPTPLKFTNTDSLQKAALEESEGAGLKLSAFGLHYSGCTALILSGQHAGIEGVVSKTGAGGGCLYITGVEPKVLIANLAFELDEEGKALKEENAARRGGPLKLKFYRNKSEMEEKIDYSWQNEKMYTGMLVPKKVVNLEGAPKDCVGANFCNLYLGQAAKRDHPEIIADATAWIKGQGFAKFLQRAVKANKEKMGSGSNCLPTLQQIQEELIELKICPHIRFRGKASASEEIDAGDVSDEIEELKERFVLHGEGEWDATSHQIGHILDNKSSGVEVCGDLFTGTTQVEGLAPFMSHVAHHDVRTNTMGPTVPSQHWEFDMERFIAMAQAHPSTTAGAHANLLEEMKSKYNNHFATVGEGGGTPTDRLMNWLNMCDGKPVVLLGNWYVDQHNPTPPHPPNELRYTPHREGRENDNVRFYAGNSVDGGLVRTRTKYDRRGKYGPGGTDSKKCYVALIEGKYRVLFERVGLPAGTEDLAWTLLPMPIHTIWEVTWGQNGLGIADSAWDLIYSNYNYE